MTTDTRAPRAEFVTAVEVQRAWPRFGAVRKTGTLRLANGHLAFEGGNGRVAVQVPLRSVTHVARHRAGLGFWVTLGEQRYFITPRDDPRPPFNAFYALLRPFATARYLRWKVRERRRGGALAEEWLAILTGHEAARPLRHRGLPRWIRTPVRGTLLACVVIVLPLVHLASALS